MEKVSNKETVQILKAINNFQYEMVKSMNYIREDIKELRVELKEFKEENNKRWDENDRRWEENNKRWDENDRRWEENSKRWKENDKRWEKYEVNRKEDRKYMLDILTNYDISISRQLGDPNVEKMQKIV